MNGQPTAAKRWCFTLNNYTEEDEKALEEKLRELCTCAIAGREVGEQGTPHLQGYFELSHRKRITSLKKINGSLQRCHFEIARGTPVSNRDYCSKEGNVVFEFGDFREKVEHSKETTTLFKRISEGKTDKELWECEETFGAMLRHYRAVAEYRRVNGEPVGSRDVTVTAHIGPPGSGKTRWVFENKPGAYFTTGERWFDGYSGQSVVVFDDFAGTESGISFPFFLRLLDRYPLQVPVKGGFVWYKPVEIHITSNLEPYEWYKTIERAIVNDSSVNPILRRIHNIIRYQ